MLRRGRQARRRYSPGGCTKKKAESDFATSGRNDSEATTVRFRKRVCELDGLENTNLNWTLNACSPRVDDKAKDNTIQFIAAGKIQERNSNVIKVKSRVLYATFR